MAHIAGLRLPVCTRVRFPTRMSSPPPRHKTPRGAAVILTNDEELAKKFNKRHLPWHTGRPGLEHVIAARRSASARRSPEFKGTSSASSLTRVLADALQKQGFDLVGGGTDNHLMLIDLRDRRDRQGAAAPSDEVYITANKNAIPERPEKSVRHLGHAHRTPAVTTRGFGAPEMLLPSLFFDNKAKAEMYAISGIY